MDTVTVRKVELHQIVQANRDKHHGEWTEAFEGYRHACIAALQANLEAFRSRKAERIFINEQPPEDHTRDYDRVLRMLTMSTHDQITLSADSFEQYVLDEWNWKRNWAATNSKYLGRP